MTLQEAAQALSQTFETADLNGDGHLSLAETLAAEPEIEASQFDTLDSDGNRLISVAELEAFLGGDGAASSSCPGIKSLPGRGLQEIVGDLFLLGVALLSLAGWSRFQEKP